MKATPQPQVLKIRSAASVVLVLFGLIAAGSPAAACVGDCDADGTVTIDELVNGVSIALGTTSDDDRTASGAPVIMGSRRWRMRTTPTPEPTVRE